VRSSSSWMNLPFLVYAYLSPSHKGKFVQAKIFASRCLLAWVFVYDYPFLEE
jgi:hypothetical protein